MASQRSDSGAPDLSPQELQEAAELRQSQILRESEKSLEAYLANVVIDARPEPKPWHDLIESWQIDIVNQLIPAIEYAAGVRKDYSGPRKIWLGLSKGHDKTGLVGRICNWAIGFAKHHVKVLACAGDKDQAGLILESIESERRLNPWIQSLIEMKGWSATGPGGTLEILSSDAPTASGQKPDIIVCDEVSFWKKRDLWDMVYGAAAKRPSCVFIVITNAGIKGTWQHELREMARMDTLNWLFFESPQGRTLASWMTPQAIEDLRKGLAKGFAKRVLDNIWIDATENPLLEESLILKCEDPDALWETYFTKFGYSPELYVGVDIGRSKDLTVCVTLERVDIQHDEYGQFLPKELHYSLVWVREILVLEKCPYRKQFEILKTRITRHVVKANIDKGAIGSQLAEDLEFEFPGKVEGVALGPGVQGKIAVQVKTYFESGMIRIPPDPDLRLDLQQVSEVETAPGGLPIIRTDSTDIGHADRFWALGLAIAGLPIDAGPKYYRAPKAMKSRYAAKIPGISGSAVGGIGGVGGIVRKALPFRMPMGVGSRLR